MRSATVVCWWPPWWRHLMSQFSTLMTTHLSEANLYLTRCFPPYKSLIAATFEISGIKFYICCQLNFSLNIVSWNLFILAYIKLMWYISSWIYELWLNIPCLFISSLCRAYFGCFIMLRLIHLYIVSSCMRASLGYMLESGLWDLNTAQM